MSISPYIQLPPPINTVFLKNPSPRLLTALGKTEKDCVPDDFGKNCRWLDLPDLPDEVEIYQDDEGTCLTVELEDEDSSVEVPAVVVVSSPAKAPRKKKSSPKPVKKVVAGLTDEEVTRLSGFEKKEFKMKFSKRIKEHFEKLRSVKPGVLDELARTKGQRFQAPIIDRGKHLKVVFAYLSPLEVQEFAEIALYVFHECELSPVIPEEHRSPKAPLEAIA